MSTKLHIMRIRSKEEPTFYDPNTDIRKIWPAVIKNSLKYLIDMFEEKEAPIEDLMYLQGCFCVYQIKIAEDPASLVELTKQYEEAINKAPIEVRAMWTQSALTLMTSIYAMFCRRDCKADEQVASQLLTTATMTQSLKHLDIKTASSVVEQLERAAVLAKQQCSIKMEGLAICQETQERINNIKEIAHLFIAYSGDSTWEALAKACDACFNNPDQVESSKIALALAYPTYNQPTLSVEVQDDKA